MKLKELVDETLKSGITPITFDFQEIKFFDDEKRLVRSTLCLHSLDLGTLTINEYKIVARRSKQGDQLIKRHIEKLVRILPSLTELNPKIECFIIPAYVKLLKGGVLAKMLFDAFTLYPNAQPSKICIEFTSDLLYQEIGETKERIEELRKMGVKIAISELGDEFCPIFRLASVPCDYAFLDQYATRSLENDDAEQVAGSLAQYMHLMGIKVIAPNLSDADKIHVAKSVGCDGYSEESERILTADDPIWAPITSAAISEAIDDQDDPLQEFHEFEKATAKSEDDAESEEEDEDTDEETDLSEESGGEEDNEA